jgi:cation diffusion facilitator family transporter
VVSEPPGARTGQGTNPAAALTRFAWLSIGAALGTMGIKTVAWAITGSVGLLSDAAESSVNLVAAVVALIALRIAARPPDEGHNFGHAKAEYFSAWFEGLMIFAAAAAIIVTSVERLLHPRALDNVAEGLVVSGLAGVLNAMVGVTLLRAGRRHRSLTLTADGKHLLTDVWTSVGVIVGVIAVSVTGFVRLDPIVALFVGVNIVVTGVRLLGRSAAGFMDHAIAPQARADLDRVLAGFSSRWGVSFHDIRTREAGRDQLVSLHVVVPGDWSVQRGHDLLGELEAALGDAMANTYVQARLEPRGAPCAEQPDDAGTPGPPTAPHEERPA